MLENHADFLPNFPDRGALGGNFCAAYCDGTGGWCFQQIHTSKHGRFS